MRGKRLLSILLVAVLAIMPVSSTVYADEPDTSVQETAQEEMVTDATYEEPFGETADGDASEEEQPGEAVEETAEEAAEETAEETAPGESAKETQPGSSSEEEQSEDGSEEALPEEATEQTQSGEVSEDKQPSEDDKEAKSEVGNEAGAPEEDKSGEDNKPQDQSVSDTDKGNEKEKEAAKNEQESDEQEGFEYSEKVDGYVITLTASDDIMPDGVKVVIERLNKKEDTEEIAGAIGEEISSGREIVEIIAFDISFYLDDKPFEPEEGTVNVSIMLDEDMDKTLKETEEEKGSYEIAVYHIDEEDEKLKAEEVECELTEENEVVFDAEKFSPYAIVLTAGDGYTVEFDGNDATGGNMEDMDCYSGTRYKLTKNAYTRRGYTFKEWNTEYDGSGDKYADEADFRNLDEKYGSYITLYAQWVPNKYTVRFDGNGSTSGSMTDMTGCKYDQDYTLASNAYKSANKKSSRNR